jgi:hypothetical protein
MKILIFISIVLLFSGCNKDPIVEDYREPFIGWFHFTTIRKGVSMCYDSSATCIDGWEIVCSDTSFIASEVEKSDTNRLKIYFGDNILKEDFNDNTIKQITYPVLSHDGELSLSGYSGEIRYFTGYFIGYDTLVLAIRPAGGIGSFVKFEVTGIREK